MMEKFNIEVPCNATGLGQVGWGVLYEIFKRGLKPNIFPVGQIDLRPFVQDAKFGFWLEQGIKKALKKFQDYPTIKLWHISSSERHLGSGKQILFTAHELDGLTPEEIEILKGYDEIFVTSNYSKEIFTKHGIT